MARTATPWDALLVPADTRQHLIESLAENAATGAAALVINGRTCRSGHEIYAALDLTVPRGGQPIRPVPGSALERRIREAEEMSLGAGEHELQGALVELATWREAWSRLYYAARHQRRKDDPAEIAKRAAWMKRNAEARRAYLEDWKARNRDRLREYNKHWSRQRRATFPEENQQAQRRYYERNREEILARSRARREAARPPKPALSPEVLQRLAEIDADTTLSPSQKASRKSYWRHRGEKAIAQAAAREAARQAKAAERLAQMPSLAQRLAEIEADPLLTPKQKANRKYYVTRRMEKLAQEAGA